MDTMLSKALREFLTGQLNQLIVNLGGENGEKVEEELKKFNRGEPCWVGEGMAGPKTSSRSILRLLTPNLIILGGHPLL